MLKSEKRNRQMCKKKQLNLNASFHMQKNYPLQCEPQEMKLQMDEIPMISYEFFFRSFIYCGSHCNQTFTNCTNQTLLPL